MMREGHLGREEGRLGWRIQSTRPRPICSCPLPGPERTWDPHTIHTHYFGFCIPEAQIGAFIYIRYHPYFPLSQGGVCIFRGLDNLYPLDMEHCDYVMTMPWPEIDGPVITTANGLRVEFLELGRRARVTYASADESVSLDVEANAVTPLAARGHVVRGRSSHVIPGEELHRDLDPGGMEQMMRMTGELAIRGETFEVDCIYPRDRSWRQLRPETVGGSGAPPVSWTPFAFGEDLSFNQVGFESPDSDPEWAGLFELPDGAPSHYFAWVWRDGELRPITRVRREVSEYHPLLLAPVKQQIEAEDSDGETLPLQGRGDRDLRDPGVVERRAPSTASFAGSPRTAGSATARASRSGTTPTSGR